MMYTLGYQLAKAFEIAEAEEKAIIGFFGHWREIQEWLPLYFSKGTFHHHSKEFKFETGARIKFYEKPVDFDRLSDQICGAQFSHVFTRSVHDYRQRALINSRIRSVEDFNAPMGYYDEFGVQRYEGY